VTTSNPGGCENSPLLSLAVAAAAAHPVCLFTHSGGPRFWQTAPRLTRSWPSEISWAVLLKDIDGGRAAAALAFTPNALRRRGVCGAALDERSHEAEMAESTSDAESQAPGRLTVTLLEGGSAFWPPGGLLRYPYNLLRSAARHQCQAPFVLMLDADLEVSPNS
jgi:hypothetical protein